jgi:hypothetical protein
MKYNPDLTTPLVCLYNLHRNVYFFHCQEKQEIVAHGRLEYSTNINIRRTKRGDWEGRERQAKEKGMVRY